VAQRRAVLGAVAAAVLAVGMSAVVSLQAAEARAAQVLINEIMYHPPEDWDDLQFVELYNAGTTAVNLSGWSLAKGIQFVFAPGTELPAGGYTVVCRDIAAFKSRYGAELNVGGVFAGKLSHKGERLELADARGQLVDAVDYADRPPWPLGADGYGGSLERICPAAEANDPANWASSAFKPAERAWGTPGRRNSCFSAAPLPQISEVQFDKAEPGKPIAVTATVVDRAGVQAVSLAWAAWPGEASMALTEIPMQLQRGDTHRGVYAGSIAAQPEGRLIRFSVRAKSEPRPTFSCATFVNTNTAQVPFLKVLTSGGFERPRRGQQRRAVVMAGVRDPAQAQSSWNSAVIYLPAGGKEVLVVDHVHVRHRKGGYKVHFHKDQPLGEMTGINLLFEASPRWLLAEPLAYELYRRAGVPAPATQHVRLWMDEQLLGYHLLVEQPNQAFFRRNGRDPHGNVYKLLWYERGVVGQHEKKTNPHTGHQDLLELIEGLNHTSGADQWDFIQQHFNVDEMLNYYAVNMCIQNWDGFFNNYFAYHAPRTGGKWEVIPWDEDKTWGDYDGASLRYDWYEMPLTFGMNGDRSARGLWQGDWPAGGGQWWRPPGYFSGPLLANPEFRRRFLSRLRVICETVFTPERMGPVINSLENRLAEEVRLRAESRGENAEVALRAFHDNIQSFHRQVTHRRGFILRELAAGR
jgi:hypothetical protein